MKFNDYDLFENGETWYMVKSEHIYVSVGNDETDLLHFEEGSEVVVLDINRENGAYGTAYIEINGHETSLGLDELYSMVWE